MLMYINHSMNFFLYCATGKCQAFKGVPHDKGRYSLPVPSVNFYQNGSKISFPCLLFPGQKFRHQLIWMLCYARRSTYFTWGSEAPTQTQGTRMDTFRQNAIPGVGPDGVSTGQNGAICVNNRKDKNMCATIKSEMYTPLKRPLWQRLSSAALLRHFTRRSAGGGSSGGSAGISGDPSYPWRTPSPVGSAGPSALACARTTASVTGVIPDDGDENVALHVEEFKDFRCDEDDDDDEQAEARHMNDSIKTEEVSMNESKI